MQQRTFLPSFRVILFGQSTDLGNATSNSIYRRIGYRAVAEALRYRFVFALTPSGITPNSVKPSCDLPANPVREQPVEEEMGIFVAIQNVFRFDRLERLLHR